MNRHNQAAARRPNPPKPKSLSQKSKVSTIFGTNRGISCTVYRYTNSLNYLIKTF